jgi:hypothetical protein
MTFRLIPIILVGFLIAIACTTSNETSDGVAMVKDSNNTIKLSNGSVDNHIKLSDEEITTRFTSCMRDQGFKTADPELNPDGTVDIIALKTNISEDQKYDPKGTKTKEALDECVPLLEDATFSKKQDTEDLIELEDNLIGFAMCLRESGINVSDPLFNDDKRASMKDVLRDVDIKNKSNAHQIEYCKSMAFGNPVTK